MNELNTVESESKGKVENKESKEATESKEKDNKEEKDKDKIVLDIEKEKTKKEKKFSLKFQMSLGFLTAIRKLLENRIVQWIVAVIIGGAGTFGIDKALPKKAHTPPISQLPIVGTQNEQSSGNELSMRLTALPSAFKIGQTMTIDNYEIEVVGTKTNTQKGLGGVYFHINKKENKELGSDLFVEEGRTALYVDNKAGKGIFISVNKVKEEVHTAEKECCSVRIGLVQLKK